MQLSSAIAEYLIEQQVRGNSAKTVAYYTQSLQRFATFSGNISLSGLNLMLCKKYYPHFLGQNLTTITVQTYIRALRAFLTWCWREGYLPENIPEKFRLPKAQRKTIDVLTDEKSGATPLPIATYRPAVTFVHSNKWPHQLHLIPQKMIVCPPAIFPAGQPRQNHQEALIIKASCSFVAVWYTFRGSNPGHPD